MINVEELNNIILEMRGPKPLKKIKVTTAFALYLKETTPPLPEKPDGFINGVVGHYDGIPVEIDDEIDGFYKFIY